ncbi:HIT domain-containing protein [bacterium]|nr:HIT domain-containing protein [bacterium]
MVKNKIISFSVGVIFSIVGFVLGGYLFSESRPRSFLAFNKCENCLHPNELIGLVASVGIRKFPNLIPSVVLETDKTIVIKHPAPADRFHYIIIPKKDIKNIGDLSESDRDYVVDIFAVVTEIIRKNNLQRYRLWTNGPSNQIVAYLHFHLAGS